MVKGDTEAQKNYSKNQSGIRDSSHLHAFNWDKIGSCIRKKKILKGRQGWEAVTSMGAIMHAWNPRTGEAEASEQTTESLGYTTGLCLKTPKTDKKLLTDLGLTLMNSFSFRL